MAKSFVRKFTFENLPIQGAVVELTDAWHIISAQKEYPDGVKQLLGELLAANVLLTTNIKLEGKIIAQIQDNPKMNLLVSECTNDLTVRATSKFSESVHEDNQISYNDCIEKGTLVISIDSNSDGKLYQSVVGLNGQNIEQILTEYMMQSEQLRTIFIIAYSPEKVVGFKLQQLPDTAKLMADEIDRVFFLAKTLKHSELMKDEISVILNRLFDEDDVVLYEPEEVEFSCTCSRERVSNMLRSLGKEEALSIIADEGSIHVTCDFCNTVYSFDNQDVEDMFKTLCIDVECVSQEVHSRKNMSSSKPTIALVGRPNVGKSTLFNRLTKSRDALVADMPGLTRDRHYGAANQGKRHYLLIDTGGFEPLIDSGIMYQMARQTEQAMAESDAVVFLVDGKGGITPQDKVIANKLRMLDKPVYIAINKVEGVDKSIAISDFYELGLPNLYPISSSHGEGVFDLIHQVLSNFPVSNEEEPEQGITFAVVGRPNVGKSTLVNAMIGEDRVIAFDESGTTRDSINISFEKYGQQYTIIDTAGIRRKGRVEDKIEKFSVLKAIQAISDANVVVLVLDAQLDIAEQDATIVGYALEAGKSIVVVINKLDNLNEEQRETVKADMKRKLQFLDFAQFNYISALHKKGIGEVFKSINQAYTSAFMKLPTPKLTRILQEAISRQPPVYKGQFRPKMRYAHQGGMNPPTIIIHGNSLENVAKSYTKYLERSFRKVFDLIGTPLRIDYKTSENPFEGRAKKVER